MLSSECRALGKFDAPVLINENVLKQGFLNADPPIMKQLFGWLLEATDNRMVVFTNKTGDSWAVMNTTRVTLNQSRSVEWVYTRSEPCFWLQNGLNPVWITVYIDALSTNRQLPKV